MLLPRILTGLVGGAVLLGAIYFGSLPFLFIVLGIILVGVREFYSLAQETGYPCYPAVGLFASALMVLSVYFNGVSFAQVTENQLTAALTALLLVVIIFRSLARGPADTSLSEWSVTFMGVFYVAWSLSHLVLIRDLRPGGRNITYLLFAMIWAEDIFAYFIGSRWGRHKIAESISPKKSWEGTIAGFIDKDGRSIISVMPNVSKMPRSSNRTAPSKERSQSDPGSRRGPAESARSL